jgi:hypothetical protein
MMSWDFVTRWIISMIALYISNESVCEVIDEVLDILSDYEPPTDAGDE